MKVTDILNAKGVDVFTVGEDDSMRDAVSILGNKNIGAVVVVDDDAGVKGILSERDVVRYAAKAGDGYLQKKVGDCMTKNVFTCSQDQTVDELMGLMTEKRIRHLPVVEKGKLAGLISIGDVVKRKIEQSEQEAEALRDYIAT